MGNKNKNKKKVYFHFGSISSTAVVSFEIDSYTWVLVLVVVTTFSKITAIVGTSIFDAKHRGSIIIQAIFTTVIGTV